MNSNEKIDTQREQIELLLASGFLVSPELLDGADSLKQVGRLVQEGSINSRIAVIFPALTSYRETQTHTDFNWEEMESSRALFEKDKHLNAYNSYLGFLNQREADKQGLHADQNLEVLPENKDMFSDIRLTEPFQEVMKKREVQDFIDLFNSRYSELQSMLMKRRELSNVVSVSRARNSESRQKLAVIGMVMDSQVTKNKNLLLKVEDPTGTISVLVNQRKAELFGQARDLVADEVVGVLGSSGKNIIFADNVISPDVVSFKELKKFTEEEYILFLSDLHVGSNNFLEGELKRFLSWINGELGDEIQKELANKVSYIFVLGDLVEGVGVYPGQEDELEIKDIYKQYEACEHYLSQIPKDKKIVVIPGNHDAVRLAEPQPPLYKDLAEPLWRLPNVKMLGNPVTINIKASRDFPGFDMLLYHGYSFPFFAEQVETIRQKGGVDRADLIMKFLLQKRHLAPTHTSTLYVPHPNKDALTISKSPDFFASGHLHKSVATNYKNITLISGSCWQSRTSYMDKLGIHPEPARVPLVNLQTRAVKILRFGK